MPDVVDDSAEAILLVDRIEQLEQIVRSLKPDEVHALAVGFARASIANLIVGTQRSVIGFPQQLAFPYPAPRNKPFVDFGLAFRLASSLQ